MKNEPEDGVPGFMELHPLKTGPLKVLFRVTARNP